MWARTNTKARKGKKQAAPLFSSRSEEGVEGDLDDVQLSSSSSEVRSTAFLWEKIIQQDYNENYTVRLVKKN